MTELLHHHIHCLALFPRFLDSTITQPPRPSMCQADISWGVVTGYWEVRWWRTALNSMTNFTAYNGDKNEGPGHWLGTARDLLGSISQLSDSMEELSGMVMTLLQILIVTTFKTPQMESTGIMEIFRMDCLDSPQQSNSHKNESLVTQ